MPRPRRRRAAPSSRTSSAIPGVVITPAGATPQPPSVSPAARSATIRGVDSRVSPPTTTARVRGARLEARCELAAEPASRSRGRAGTPRRGLAVRRSRTASSSSPALLFAAAGFGVGAGAGSGGRMRTRTVTIWPSRTRTPAGSAASVVATENEPSRPSTETGSVRTALVSAPGFPPGRDTGVRGSVAASSIVQPGAGFPVRSGTIGRPFSATASRTTAPRPARS